MQTLGGKQGVLWEMRKWKILFHGYSPLQHNSRKIHQHFTMQIERHGVIRAINSVDSLFKRCFCPCRRRFLISLSPRHIIIKENNSSKYVTRPRHKMSRPKTD